jgi:DNA-binding MarR family transcriptional regulator
MSLAGSVPDSQHRARHVRSSCQIQRSYTSRVSQPDQIGPELSDVVSRLRRAMRRAARAADPGTTLSVAQLEVLSCVAENPGLRPGELARALRLAPSSVATLLNALGAAGLVARESLPADRRSVSLTLTAEGTRAVTRWQDVNASVISAALGSLPDTARASLASAAPALRDLTAAIDALAS